MLTEKSKLIKHISDNCMERVDNHGNVPMYGDSCRCSFESYRGTLN